MSPENPTNTKRLFLIDAMGYIFRAFYAPMPMRMRSPAGHPTNVPYPVSYTHLDVYKRQV